jgi:MoxR-like ATPase
LFHNLILADEINRAPAKVQSALLEAMEERQITVGEKTYSLPGLFLVMATQNPIEQEGTYPLPEAQLDRFLLHVNVSYPDRDAERSILRINRSEALNGGGVPAQASSRVPEAVILAARKAVLELHLADSLEDYILEIVLATRDTARYGDDLDGLLQYGASPRASIALDRASRARAWLNGRDFVTPDDIQNVAPSVLRHRVLLSFEAEAEGYDADTVITRLLERIAVP